MNITKQKQTDRYREQTSDYQRGEERKEGQNRVRELRECNQYFIITLSRV